MRWKPVLAAVVAAVVCAYATASISQATSAKRPPRVAHGNDFDRIIRQHATAMVEEGRETFRYDTFGDEAFWGDLLRLHEAVLGSAQGGVGPGLSPRLALQLGLKVDASSLSRETLDAVKSGTVDLDDPAVTVELLRQNAVVGVTGFFGGDGRLRSMGIQCALCHSVVDNSVAPGIGERLDGWANRDLNVGAIVALAPNLQPFATLLGTDVATVRTVLNSWGPGKFDAELILDGKAFRPDGKSAATLIPPAFGLAGVNLHTWTGWGSVTHWNAFVANLEMHGKGTFFDPRLDDAARFPIAAANGFGHVTSEEDRITAKLPALHFYQLAIPAPKPPHGTFDATRAARGDGLFSGKARCATCHTDELYTEPGWNLHRPEEIGIDAFQAERSPDRRYRTSPLKGLWTHAKGGFYHDGRFATLLDVVNHYDSFFGLGLSPGEKGDLVEYLKSLGDDVPALARVAVPAATAATERRASAGWSLRLGPSPAHRAAGIRLELNGVAAHEAPADLVLRVYDVRGRLVRTVSRAEFVFDRGGARAGWDGKDDRRRDVPAGVYFIRVDAPTADYSIERKVVLR